MAPHRESPPGSSAAPELFQLFDPLFHWARDGVFLTQPDGKILCANPAACASLGRTEDEIRRLGRDGLMVADLEAKRLEEKRQRTGHVVGELTFRRADGSTFRVEFSSSVLPSSSLVQLAVVFFRDVTVERATVAALEDSRLRLSFALEGSNTGTWDWIVGEPGVTVNRQWLEILGVRPAEEEAVYPTALWTEAIHPEDAGRVIAAAEDLAGGRLERYDFEYRLADRDGTWKWVRSRARAVARNPDGTVRRIAGTLVDVTRDRRAAAGD